MHGLAVDCQPGQVHNGRRTAAEGGGGWTPWGTREVTVSSSNGLALHGVVDVRVTWPGILGRCSDWASRSEGGHPVARRAWQEYVGDNFVASGGGARTRVATA